MDGLDVFFWPILSAAAVFDVVGLGITNDLMCRNWEFGVFDVYRWDLGRESTRDLTYGNGRVNGS
jgi:hypothetical protein